ncbi:MAG: hypothetical protein AAGI09_01425 [Pseudomonadota bacterium]
MLRISLIALLAAGALSSAAHADCSSVSGIPSGAIVTCDPVSVLDGPDAIETRGIEDGSDEITINVLTGAILDTTGSIDRTINLKDSANSVVTNDGTILSGDEGIQGGDALKVTNRGLVEAVEKAVDANGDGVEVENAVGARITSSTNEGIETGDGAKIVNFGIVEAFDDAIQVGEDALIENYGIIRNTQVDADIVGDVEAQDAIDLDSGTVRNFAGAEITSQTNAAIDFDPGAGPSLIENAGLIAGTLAVTVDEADDADQEIVNSGTLQGSSGVAVDLGMGEDTVTLKASSIVMGDILLGDDADMLIFEGSDFAGLSTSDLYVGGDDLDMVIFADFTGSDIFDVVLSGLNVELSLMRGGESLAVTLTEFEQFKFGSGSTQTVLGFEDLTELAAIPLPAAGLLLLGGLGVLGAARAGRIRA